MNKLNWVHVLLCPRWCNLVVPRDDPFHNGTIRQPPIQCFILLTFLKSRLLEKSLHMTDDFNSFLSVNPSLYYSSFFNMYCPKYKLPVVRPNRCVYQDPRTKTSRCNGPEWNWTENMKVLDHIGLTYLRAWWFINLWLIAY